jgi:c-di-GMP-related signal transduction protein
MMRHGELPASKLAYLELLRAATAVEFDIEELALKIKHEASLTFRLLRYLNSAAFGLRSEVHSVTHALSLLGERELRKWIAVVSVGVLADEKPDELMTVPLVRGRFCEILAPLAGLAGHANDLFLMGLLSVIDAILDQPLETILVELPVRLEIKEALLSQKGVYSRLLEIAVAHEFAEWDKVSAIAQETRMSEERISAMYVEAVDWSRALGRSVQAPVAK